MAVISPETIAAARAELGIAPERLPRSVAIIMDGNGRWARHRGLPRTAGHAAGAILVRHIVTEGVRLGLDAMAFYTFSLDNWNRPDDEIAVLMDLYADYLRQERVTMLENNIRFRHLGRREGLPARVLEELDGCTEATSRCTGTFLCLALNYGSRAEITDAVRRIASLVAAGEVRPDQVDDKLISGSLDTAGVPDPDLLIRTSGEMRVSNFLLWQISYTELYVTDACWPDFTVERFRQALQSYASRRRRFGGLDSANA